MEKDKEVKSNKNIKLVNFYMDGKWRVINLDLWLRNDPFKSFLKKLEIK